MLRAAEEEGVHRHDLVDHPVHDHPHLGGGVGLIGEHVIAEEGQRVDRVVEVRRSCQWQHVARDLLGPLLDRPSETVLRVVRGRPGAGRKNAAIAGGDFRGQQFGEATIPLERAGDRGVVDPLCGGWQVRAKHRRPGHLAVALGDLLGVVERMAVEEGPNREAGDVVEHEDERGVLQRRVVPGREEVGVELQGTIAAVDAIGRLVGRESAVVAV